jgi:N-acetylglucosamine-6-phosphate deacetylase
MTKDVVWLCPDQIFDTATLQRGLAIAISNGKVQAVAPLPAGAQGHAIAGVVTPGYLDLQVNGGGDVQLNNTPTVQGMRTIAAAHHRFGTVAVLPTVITDAPDVLARAVQAAIDAKGLPGVLGLHIEGPHISFPRRGTHAAEFIRPFDTQTLRHVERLRAAGITVMITVAPEAVKPGQIADLVATGAIVSLGHTDTTTEAVQAALAEGACCFTHLFNAMSPMLNRAPGVTGAAINSDAYCGFICDGHHVADAMLGLAIRARPVADRMFVVSDAMSTVGGSDHFTIYGQEIRLVNGRLVNTEGSLAGAHVTMAQSVARLITVLGIAAEQALRMAVTVPAQVIRAPDLAQIIGRDTDDLLILGADWMPKARVADLVLA